jgi:DNA-3-methyladenine glycosylase II
MDKVPNLSVAESKLKELDPKLGELIELQGPIEREPRSDYFFSLIRSIISQQVSVASAAAIFSRFETATKMDPNIVMSKSDEELRAVGLSHQKTGYVRDLAAHFVADPQVYDHLGELPDDDVAAELIKVKGVGPWTAQMFLMFTLSRPDVFAPDDVGLQRAMKQLYGWTEVPPKEKLTQTADKWRPYRTIACWHLWESLHNAPQ